jgi:hypothetical protein
MGVGLVRLLPHRRTQVFDPPIVGFSVVLAPDETGRALAAAVELLCIDGQHQNLATYDRWPHETLQGLLNRSTAKALRHLPRSLR